MTRYHADAYFGPRVRTCSRNAIQPLHQLRLHVRRLLPRQRTLWGVGRIRRHSAAIERYGSSEYESLLGMGRGRTSIRRGCGRNGHRSFGNLRPRGRAPFETPYRAICTIHSLAPDFGIAACRLAVEECVDTGVSAPRATARHATSPWKPPAAASSSWSCSSAWIARARSAYQLTCHRSVTFWSKVNSPGLPARHFPLTLLFVHDVPVSEWATIRTPCRTWLACCSWSTIRFPSISFWRIGT